MATNDSRIERITNDVLASRQLPAECSTTFIHNNALTEVTLGDWAKSRNSKIRFLIDLSGGDDDYDQPQLCKEEARETLRWAAAALLHQTFAEARMSNGRRRG